MKNEQEALRKSYNGKITELGQQETILRVQLEQIPTKIKDAETRLRQAEQKEKEMVAVEREKRTKVYNETLLALDGEKNARTQQRIKRDKDLKAADSDYNAAIRDLRSDSTLLGKSRQMRKKPRKRH